jgi:putative nucleotidyltransferase with HDIG domain
MAIDAKDQVTHGHIRRVQTQATRLAKEVGVRDERLIKAIEAAALLHDMGKLAVPEYILNKPGKLTDAEFAKMKLHASVGADILSAIDFPYPVVPIVRYHHENWDGTGYPERLRGTEIPIGARILSVVDCFDALTSDRPYRPKLSDEEAIQVLLDRRGTMYDPLIVDTFIKVNAADHIEADRQISDHESVRSISGSQGPAPHIESPRLDEIAASADEMPTLYELARATAGNVSPAEAADTIANHLRRLIPFSLCVFYEYDAFRDELEASHTVGDGRSSVHGLRIPLGQRLSGWVAANRRTICNSDPTLDFGDAARSQSVRLRSCISTPLILGEHLTGVMTLYATETNAFNDDHRRIVELIAKQIAHLFTRSADHSLSHRDSVGPLPSHPSNRRAH